MADPYAGGADRDALVRTAAFAFLRDQTRLRGDVLPRDLLAAGFQFEGIRVPLLGPQGIFKPAVLPEIPLSITTVPVIEGRPRPYEDEVGPDGLLRYRYRGTDSNHRDNVGLRLAIGRRTPLVYLYGLVPGQYLPIWPVFVVGDHPDELSFSIAVEPGRELAASLANYDLSTETETAARREYATRIVLQRMHQLGFRQRVLRAYRETCAVCRLRHAELLDAAHILPDGHPLGEPVISNGLALCKLHHAAFDRSILGIRPDLTIEIRADVLEEHDGPMLLHGLQGFNGAGLVVPKREDLRPNRDFLAERYELFRRAN